MGGGRTAAGDSGDPRLTAHVKRFHERWVGDDRFRAAVDADPAAAAAGLGLDLDPGPLSFLWEDTAPQDPDAPEVRAFQSLMNRGQAYLEYCTNDGGAVTAYQRWRARQRARTAFAVGALIAPAQLHLPFAVELTRGCSLGCWFCGVSARPLNAVLRTDLKRWEDLLQALRGVFGASVKRGFLYWATDPLDHPDYEAHAEVFRRVCGRFPPTTTAAPLADPARTRRLAAMAFAGDCPPQGMRFSVVSRRQLEEIHATFSTEELLEITLVPVNRESLLALAEAGHAREMAKRRPERAAFERRKLSESDDDQIRSHRTIACVSGFLIDPISGRIRLISTTPASDRWPDGYVVFDEKGFDSVDEFAEALETMVRRNMGPEPPDRLMLQDGVRLSAASAGGVKASARGHETTFRAGRRDLGHVPALAAAFDGGARLDEVSERIAGRFGIDSAKVRADAASLWREGVLVEPLFAADAAAEGTAA